MIDYTAILTLLIICQHLLSNKDIREQSKFCAYSRDEEAFADCYDTERHWRRDGTPGRNQCPPGRGLRAESTRTTYSAIPVLRGQ